jgi:methionine synthase II (cobalamin-independent)
MAASYRADQVGSLLRPPEVLEAHTAFREGKLSLEQLRQVEDAGILTALKLQQEVGLDVLSDGEYRRGGWASDFNDAVEGYVPGPPPVTIDWRLGKGEPRPLSEAPLTALGAGAGSQVVGEKLRQKRRMTAHESGFLSQHASGAYKVTLPAASYVVARGFKPGITDRVYPTRAALLDDVTAIIRAEIGALIAEGVPYVQIDNPHYPDYVDENKRGQWSAMGIDPDQALDEDVAADYACLRGLNRAGVTLAMHLCRGNGRSAWHTSGGYDRIAEKVFGGIDVDRWLLEYDSDRAGTFDALSLMPKGKTVVLGLVTTKEGALESQDDLLRRIDEASKFIPAESLALSPQCGFASVAQGNLLSWDDQRRKLELVVATARKAWSTVRA